VLIAIFATLLFDEKMTLLKACGILLSVAGAVVAISKGSLALLFSGGFGLGELMILCCVASWVSFSLIGKVAMQGMSPLRSITLSSIAGMVFLLVPAAREGVFSDMWQYGAPAWIALLYLGIFGTVLGFVWYYQGIALIGTMRAGLFINFVPISAIFLAWGLLGEPITSSLLVGLVLVLTGVYLTNRPPAATRQGEPAGGVNPRRADSGQ